MPKITLPKKHKPLAIGIIVTVPAIAMILWYRGIIEARRAIGFAISFVCFFIGTMSVTESIYTILSAMVVATTGSLFFMLHPRSSSHKDETDVVVFILIAIGIAIIAYIMMRPSPHKKKPKNSEKNLTKDRK